MRFNKAFVLTYQRIWFISACSSISIHISNTLRSCNEDIIVKLVEMFELMPRLVNETLYFWIIRSGLMFIKVQTDKDDQILLEDHCDFIMKILRFGLSASILKLIPISKLLH